MKKTITAICLVMSISLASSQEMHVASGGSVFVATNEALYVNNNLSVNASGSLTLNSDNSNSSSLIVSGTVTGNITYQRFLSDNGNGWHLLSAPVTTQNINDFATNVSGNNSILTSGIRYAIGAYNNSAAPGTRWEYYDTTTAPAAGNFVSGQGYSTRRTEAGLVTFEGSATTSDVQINLTTASGNHHWSCVGNPFPSYLPANFTASATNVLGQNLSTLDPSFAALYFWDGTEYSIINQISGAVYLSPGQSFMVNANSDNETFTFSQSLRSHENVTDVFNRTENTIPTIDIHLSNGSQDKTTRIMYLPFATTGLDVGYDAGNYYDGTPSFSLDTHLVTDSEGIDFRLQCLPDNAYETLAVALSVRSAANQELVFSVNTEHLPEDVNVYIEDKETGSFTEITEKGYSVTPENQLTGIGRFYMHTADKTLSDNNPELSSSLNIYQITDSKLRITGMENHENVSMEMYSISGKLVLDHSFKGKTVNDITLPKLATGVYIVNVMSNASQQTKKIIIQ